MYKKENLNYKIYALKEKNSKEIKYIGITKKTLKERFRRHLNDKKIDHKTNWIKKAGIDNIEIVLIEENVESYDLLCEKEIYYIDKYKKEGHKLTNITNGGEGWNGSKFTEDHRKNISLNHADVSGEKNPMFNKKHSKEVIDICRNTNIGRKASIETRIKLSNKRKGEKNSNSKLKEKDVLKIRELFESGLYTMTTLSEMFNVNSPAIHKIVKRLTWKHI